LHQFGEITLKEPYEVEIKLPLPDKDAMRKAIADIGGTLLNSETHSDIYYDHPCRSFSITDESIRIRHRTRTEGPPLSESGQTPVEITYKGPKIDNTTKTRLEYTANIDENELNAMTQILLRTGFKHVATVVKHRTFFDIDGITANIDTVTDVGDYIEFELISDGKDEMKKARDRILKLANTLGLDEKNTIRESYLEIYQLRKS
jgi:adenylate cyclase class 2